MYEWNKELLKQYEGRIAYIGGIQVIYGNEYPQKVLELIYNDPNRKGLVIKKDKTAESKPQK